MILLRHKSSTFNFLIGWDFRTVLSADWTKTRYGFSSSLFQNNFDFKLLNSIFGNQIYYNVS